MYVYIDIHTNIYNYYIIYISMLCVYYSVLITIL